MGLFLKLAAVDFCILALYFACVLGIGWRLRKKVHSSGDFLLSGRAVPVWITSLALLAANLGAQELIGMSASGAKYGIMTAHFYWIGAVPAMLFVGVFMMPFYYGSRARSVPEYLKLRFDEKTRGFNAIMFAVMTIFSSGISMYALGLLFQLVLGWSFSQSVLLSAAIVLSYTSLGGLTSAIYNEVLQFFLIVMVPGIVALSLSKMTIGYDIPMKFGYPDYDQVLTTLMSKFYPAGMLGVGITALMASFMSGMAGNVTAFNTVFTYDIYQSYIHKGAPDSHYLKVGRITTVAGTVLSIMTAYLAQHYNNIMDLLQLVFGFVNAPLFATFLLAMFWRRATGHGAFAGLLAGTAAAAATHGLTVAEQKGGWLGAVVYSFPSTMAQNFWIAIFAWSACFLVTIGISLATRARPDEELRGLVYW